MKSDIDSNLFKISGNEKFAKRQFRDAIIDYNRGLCLAESNAQMSLLFANRSAVYFEVKRYSASLENIKLAKQLGYPADKIDKLLIREEKCKTLIETDDCNKDKISSDFFKLSYNNHKTIPFIVDALEIKQSKKYGRYIVTNRDLKTGDVIAIEEPYIKILHDEFQYERCSYCLKHNYFDLMPCSRCSRVMYCWGTCRDLHAKYCHLMTCSLDKLASTKSTLIIRIGTSMMMKAIDTCGSIEAYSDLIKNPKGLTMFDFNELSDDDYTTMITSMSMSEYSKNGINEFIENWNDLFDYLPFKEHWTTPEERKNLIECFQCTMRILNTNLLQFQEHRQEKNGTWSPDSMGSGVCPFGALFNHHCDSNIGRVTVDNKIVFYVERPIKKGEQLFISYGPVFSRKGRDERQKELMQYSFKCDCDACEKNLPLIKNLPKKTKRFMEPNFGTFDANAAIDHFKKNCLFIEKNWGLHPCYETTKLMIHNEHLIHQIAKPEL